jgi:hypothetical protein
MKQSKRLQRTLAPGLVPLSPASKVMAQAPTSTAMPKLAENNYAQGSG